MDINIQNVACSGKIRSISNKPHWSDIWGSIHWKVKQHWGWVEQIRSI